MKLVLEQRYLFDGSVAATAHHAAASEHHHVGYIADAASAFHGQHHHTGTAFKPAAYDEIAATRRAGAGEVVLFVDQQVTDWQALVAGAKPNVDVVMLNPNQDGIAQVTQALSGLSNVKAIEFLTDGTPGSITLGGTTLNEATLLARQSEIIDWSAHLASNAQVVFWGCDVAQGSAGQTFVDSVHTLMGADVQNLAVEASTNAVGAAALGGSWNLDVSVGPAQHDIVPFTHAATESYTGILDTPAPTVTLGVSPATAETTPGTVLLGDTLTANLTFSNAAENAAGYAPYIDVFVQSGLTLTGSVSGGTVVGHVTLSGGSITNPWTGATETVPTGYDGGTLYVIELPYGSFTPGEPAAAVAATFQVASTPALVGTNLGIEAIGGFRYGADATGGSNIENVAGAQTQTDTVNLVESYTTVTTAYGEDETATGPDFPVSYEVHFITAPAVTGGNPIDNLTTSLLLPNDVVWTGGSVSASGGGSASVTSAAGGGGTEQTVNISYASISGTQTVTIPVYVPQNYQYTDGSNTVNTPILDPATGAPEQVTLTAYTYTATAWDGVSIGTESGGVSGASFSAKSLAIQLTADTSSALPTQDINYTMTFEVSDYFGISGLTLMPLTNDGLTFDPTVTPVLTVTSGSHGGVSGTSDFTVTASSTSQENGETVNVSGGGTNWSYQYDTSGNTGSTQIVFNVGQQLTGLYGAGTVGSVTFSGMILEKYPNATDNITSAGGFLREGDTVSTGSTDNTAASLYDYQGGTSYSASVGSISDTTATPVDTLPEGSVSLAIAYVDGVAYTGQSIAPGDTVVYELVYNLPDGVNFGDLGMTAYLPEPVFSAGNPTNPDATDYSGSASFNFTELGVAAASLASGQYTYSLTSDLVADGVTVGGGTGSEPTNGVSFTAEGSAGSTYNFSPTYTPQAITIDFAVTASSSPFINGLLLTAQGDSTFTPAHTAAFATQATTAVQMAEPSLTVQQGVVSIVDDSGTVIDGASGVSWSNGASSAPTSVFSAAGSGSVFTAGTGPAALNDAYDNLNLAGAQAGDTVRIVDAVQNTGAFPAYDVILKDALANGLSTSDIANLTFTLGDGTVLTAIDPNTGAAISGAAAVSDFFGATGLLLVKGGSTGNAVLSASGSASDIVYVTYDVTLPASTPTAASLTGQASIVGFTNQDVYHATGSSYTLTDSNGTDVNFADDPALGLTLTDTATVATQAPSVTDTITGGSDASDTSATVPTNTYPTNTATAVPGETLNLEATITLPQGDNNDVVLTDILPAGLTAITTAGSYTVTLHQNDGTTTDLTADAAWNGQTLTLTLPGSVQVGVHAGGDQAATIVVDYQALVPQTSSTPLSGAAIHNTTVTDPFAANSEGLSYGTTTETTTSTTDGTANASGVANHITVTNPVVTASLTELNGTNGETVYSQEQVTYQLTLTNTSTSATAYDLGANIALPSGLTYVSGSLVELSGGGTLSDANVGSDGVAPGGDAISGVTLAPGATAVLTFVATVNDNLAAGTTLKVTSQPDWNSLPDNATVDGAGNVNPNAQAYLGAQGSVQNNVGALAPVLSVVGSSNDTAGLGTADNGQEFDPAGTTTATSVATVTGEVVRMRATLQVPEGENNDVTLTVTLPTGLTLDPNAATDGSVTYLLVSPNGTGLSSSTLGNIGELAEGTGFSTAKLDLGTGADTADVVIQVLPGSAIQVTGQTITFSLGSLTDNQNSANADYVVVEFNAIVGTGGTNPLTSSLTGSANAVNTSTVHDYVTQEAPDVTLTKQVTGITYNDDGSATVTYVDTITNTGNQPAYQLDLTDPGIGVGGDTSSYVGTSGSGTGVSASASNGGLAATLASLGIGDSQQFTYTVTIPQGQVDTAVSDAASTATVTSYALNPAHETGGQEVLAGTSATPAQSSANAAAGLDVVSGTVNQDVSATEGADSSLLPLSGQTVAVTFTGQTGSESVQTDASGDYTVLVPDNAGVTHITATASGSNVPANDVLDNHPDQGASLVGTGASTTGTDPATLNFTPAANTNYTGVTFDFWHALDTAPVLANGPTGTTTFTSGGTPTALFPNATVTDQQLDASFGGDFSGTTLTIQRYASGTASPDASDIFAGSGTAGSGVFLNTSNDEILLNGAQIGTFMEAGGVLAIKFASTGVSETMVDTVLQGLTYSYSGVPNPPSNGVTIGAQIDDANNDPIVLSGGTPDPTGPHDQGPGGDLLSNVLISTVNVVPPPVVPSLSIVGSSNDTAGLGTQFDPTGTSSLTSVLTTDGEIVRMRATLELSEGTNTGVSMTVTLPTGLTFQNDGSVTLLLVSPNGDLTPVTLTISGGQLQLAEGSGINPSKLDLGTGSDTTDPVVTALPDSAISVNGQQVTFNLGTLTNFDGSTTVPNYAIVEFNAIVGSSVAGGTQLTTTMTGSADGTATTTVSDYVNVEAPDVSVAKVIQGITYNADGSATITYVDTVSNTGDASAYQVDFIDPGASEGTPAYIGTSGTGTGASAGTNSTGIQGSLTSLGAGDSQNFTYSVTIPANQVDNTVTDAASTVTVTSSPLNPAHEAGGQETLAGTTETPPTDTAQAAAGLDAVSGTVNQDVSSTEGSDSLLDPLPSQTVSITFAGQSGSENVQTAADGSYTVLVPDHGGAVTITTSVGLPHAPSGDVLDNHPDQTASLTGTGASTTGTNPASLTFTPGAGTSYGGVAFDFWHAIPATTPTLSIVGSSNDTAGHGTLFDPTGQTTDTSVSTTDGEIVRMRATLELSEGTNTGVAMTVTLPTGLTLDPNYATDGSVTVLLVSSSGTFVTTLSGSNLQLVEGSGFNTGKLDLGTGADTTDPVVAVLPAGAISIAGQTVTFSLGTLTNLGGSPAVPVYAIVEFNAIVGANVAGGTSLTTAMTGTANGTSTTTVNDYANVVAPDVSVTKVIQGITYNADGSATITYVDTVSNTGDASAYQVDFTDPGASEGTPAYIGTSGTGTGASAVTNSTGIQGSLTSLGAGDSQNFTYSVTIPANQVDNTVTDAASTVTVTSSPLNPAHETSGQETLAGTTETPPTDTAQASAGLDAVSGTVNQDVSSTEGSDSLLDPLPSQTVSITFAGQSGSENVQTAADGSYTVLVPDHGGAVTITTSVGLPHAPSGDVLDNHPDQTASLTGTGASTAGTNPASLTFTPGAGTSYGGVAFDFWRAAPTTTPTLSIVGSSNDTAGHGTLFDPTGQTTDTSVLTTDGEIVRMRATLELSEGTNTGVAMTVTLPTGLTLDPNYATDGSVTVLLVSSSGTFVTTLSGSNLQLVEGGGFNTGKLDLGTGADTTDPVVAVLPANAISITGQTVTFSLGTLTNLGGSPAVPVYAIVEFNAIVGANVAGGTSLTSAMTGTANGSSTTTVNDYVNVEAPDVSMTKQVAGITYNANGSETITYVDTVTNTGDGPAYQVDLNDPGAGVGTASYTGTSGTGTGIAAGVNGSGIQASLTSLGAGDAQQFTYTVTIPATETAQAASSASTPATLTSSPLNPSHETGGKETLAGTTETPPTDATQASAGFDLISGTVNQDVAATEGSDTQLVPLAGQTISVTFNTPLGSETGQILTGTDGSYALLVPDTATSVTLGVVAGGSNAPANDVLDNQPGAAASLVGTGVSVAGTNPVTLSFTPVADHAYTGIPFDFWHSLDTAPVLAGASATPPTFTMTEQPVVLFPNGTVSDAQLDPQFAGDFSGTTLVVQRYANGTAAPNSGDMFGGSGPLVLDTADGHVLYNNALIGSFTETGGKLVISFADSGVSNAIVNGVLQNLTYSFTGSLGTAVTGTAVFGAQIDDANSDPIGMNGVENDPSGVHDQGPGGNMLSNVLVASVDLKSSPVVPPIMPTPPETPFGAPLGNFPDDLSQLPFGNPNFGYTNDWLAQTVIPELWLTGSEYDHYIIVEQRATIVLPDGLFTDSVPDAHLTYDAKQPDGSPLPSWLSFDSTTLTFTGTPPASAVGRVDVVITAYDPAGNSADAQLSILVGHRMGDLIGLIRGQRPGGMSLSPQSIRALHLGSAQPVHRAPEKHVDHTQLDNHAPTATPHVARHPTALRHQPAGLTGALRSAGPMGALTRARALLDALDSLAASRPAA